LYLTRDRTAIETLNTVESWVAEQNDLNETAVTQAKQSFESARQIEAQDIEAGVAAILLA